MVMEECLQEVGKDGLIGVAKVNAVGAEVDGGGVNEVWGAGVVGMHGRQSCARKSALEWRSGIEPDVEFPSAAFELLVEHGWDVKSMVLAVEEGGVCWLRSSVGGGGEVEVVGAFVEFEA